jgi:L,D-peptidoglycan transpeptidase YkuD (ErfK/YbiS/YcfS/YnhG family)
MGAPIGHSSVARVRPDRPGATRGIIELGPVRLTCALGRSGVRDDKREGDGATPAGNWPVRNVLFRQDKLILPHLSWDVSAIQPDDGWCDDPLSPLYNRPVTHPVSVSAERLWRDDDVYDIIVVLGHNDRPPIPGLGSAIFMHVARAGYAPTEGCIALKREDLVSLLVHRPRLASLRITEN